MGVALGYMDEDEDGRPRLVVAEAPDWVAEMVEDMARLDAADYCEGVRLLPPREDTRRRAAYYAMDRMWFPL